MTSNSSRRSSRDLNRSSGSRSPRSEYSNTRSHSRYQSRSPRSCSRTSSRSRSGSDRSRSWTRSRSNSRWHRKSYASRSRSRTRSRSSSSDNNLDSGRSGGRRFSYSRSDRSFSRSRSSSNLVSRSSSSSRTSPSDAKTRNKDPRDRSRRVHWPNGVWIVGEKAKDTTFHFCDICDLPIVIYGRLLPCKHVFCYTCALNLSGKCNRCQKSVQNVERCLVGGIFMCFRSDCCHRTYLSQRDLQAHIDHRHRTVATGGGGTAPTSAVVALASSGSVASTVPVKPVPSIRSTVETCLHQPTVMSQSFQVNPSPAIISMPPRSLPVPAASPSPDEFVGKASGLLPLPPKPSQLIPQPMVSSRHRVGLPRGPNSSLLPVGTGFQSFHSNKGALPPVLLPTVRGPSLSTFVDVPPPVPVVSSVSTSSASSSTASVSATMTALAMAAAASLSSHSMLVDNQQNRTAPQVGLNLSLLSTALRAVDPGWARGNVTAAAGNVRPAILGPRGLTGQMLPSRLHPGAGGGADQQPTNRFPF